MDDDILSQGGDREPSSWPRRLAVIGAVIVVAVAGVVYLSLPHHRQAPAAAAPTPTPTASPVPAPAPASTPVSISFAAPGLPAEPDGILGHTASWDASLRIPVTGTRPALFSPATGRSEPIGGLPADSSGYQFTRVGGGWAVQASPVTAIACGDCAGPPLPVWFLADNARSAVRIGTANQVAPAATGGAVWLTSYPPAADTATAAGIAREVSAAGAPLGVTVALPSGYAIAQGTDRGLLLAPASPQPGSAVYRLWTPAAPTFAGLIAASPAAIAWTSARCAPACQVQVLDLATGKHTVVTLPPGSTAADGAFSPSGGSLALQLTSGDDGALAQRLEVASVTSGRLTAVPGTSVSSDALVGFGWPTGGDSLVAEFIFTTKVQLASWRPGAARLAVTVIPGRSQASLIVG